MMSSRSSVRSSDTLQKRIPKNPKYDHVQATLDTGLTVNKVVAITTREFLKRREELFKRVKAGSLYQLLIDNEERDESIYDLAAGSTFAGPTIVEDSKVVTVEAAEGEGPAANVKPYLILDVRDPEEYEKFHILEARSFPAPRISQDRITPELFSFKNKEDRMIVVYCNDEKLSSEVATKFVQKGWENVYLLAGGLRRAAAKYPLIVEGSVPEDFADTSSVFSDRDSTISSRAHGPDDSPPRGATGAKSVRSAVTSRSRTNLSVRK